jgi:DNA-binding NarL/FixJ family response regulator
MAKIRVVLADDHSILRDGLRALLGYYNDVEVVGEAQDGLEAIACVGSLHPDVVLMDAAMPAMDGVEATRIIHEKYPETRVLVLTQYDDWRYLWPLLQAGASGYITKRAMGDELVSALRAVARGEVLFQPGVFPQPTATAIVGGVHPQAGGQVVTPETLSAREREVLKEIVMGQTNAQIAKARAISVKTVEWHRANLMGKLGVHSVADLVRCALQHGLVDHDL